MWDRGSGIGDEKKKKTVERTPFSNLETSDRYITSLTRGDSVTHPSPGKIRQAPGAPLPLGT